MTPELTPADLDALVARLNDLSALAAGAPGWKWSVSAAVLEKSAAALAALRADAERLDWLDSVNAHINELSGTKYGWKFDVNHNRASLSDHHLPALSIRAAIDAAREAKP